jgi:RNA polymerase sigma-70 factor (ECF subfamily)
MNHEESDESVLQRLGAGDLGALEALYDRYASGMYQYLVATCSSEADAEDVLQDVFLALVRMGRKVSRINDLRSYLLVAARNRAASMARRRNAEGRRLQRLPSPGRQNAEDAGAGHAWQVQDALHKLPSEQREVVALKIWQGMTFLEIGKVLRISADTAASRYRYAIAKLREILGGMFDERR